MSARARRGWVLGLIAASAVLAAGGAVIFGQQKPKPPPPPLTDQEWTRALTAVRKIALDPGQPDAHRANAVIAYAKMQLFRGQVADATKVCLEVFLNPTNPPVATAAVLAGFHVRRHTAGHLGGPAALIAEWERKATGGASRQALNTARNDLARFRAVLMTTAGRNPLPAARHPPMPPWGAPRPGAGPAALAIRRPQVTVPGYVKPRKDQGPSALTVKLPVINAPTWTGREADGTPKPLKLTLPTYTPPAWYAAKDPKTRMPRALVLTLPTYTPPSWYTARDSRSRIPNALAVTLPAYGPPAWYARVSFPRLKEAPKKK